MVMGHKEKMNGDEHDAFTGWKKLLNWRAGVRKKIKKANHKKIRQQTKKELDEYEGF